MYNLEYSALIEKQRRLDEYGYAADAQRAAMAAGAFDHPARFLHLLAGLGGLLISWGTGLQARYGSLQPERPEVSSAHPCAEPSPAFYR